VSRAPAIHQFIPSFAARDAVGQHTLRLRTLLRDLGFDSDIYAEDVHPELRGQALDYRTFAPPPGTPTWLLYQASTGSPMGDWLQTRPEPLLLDYHNITPVEMFAPWEPVVAAVLRRARAQLARLAPRSRLGFADSTFNAGEIDDLGCPRTVVAPILLDPGAFECGVDAAVLDRLGAGSGVAWLFVGRLAPNKAQHDVLKAFALYRRVFDSRARLWLVGGSSSDAYVRALRSLAQRLGVASAVEFAGSVSQEALVAYYRAADVFVCLSDHEGFCVPLLESMAHGVPVVAFGSSAVPETLGSAGVCLPEKSPGVVASAVWRVVSDRSVRDALVAAGHRRLQDFSLERTRATYADAIKQFVEAA